MKKVARELLAQAKRLTNKDFRNNKLPNLQPSVARPESSKGLMIRDSPRPSKTQSLPPDFRKQLVCSVKGLARITGDSWGDYSGRF